MDSDYVFLTEKEAMWAEMLMEALQKSLELAGTGNEPRKGTA